MEKFRLAVNIDGEEHPVTFEGEFEEGEWDDLRCFSDFADQLMETEFVRSGGSKSRLSFDFNENTGVSFHAVSPPPDQLSAFLHRLRPFILNNERTNFGKICNLLSKRLRGAPFTRLISALKHQYSGKQTQSMMIVKSKDMILNSDEALMLWLNSQEYHRDPSKAQELENIHQIVPVDFSIPIFVGLLIDKVEAISKLSATIKVIQGESGNRVDFGNMVEPKEKKAPHKGNE